MIKNEKQKITEKIPQDVDCKKFTNITEADVANEYLSSIKTGKIGCYCQTDMVNRIYQQFPQANNEYICLDWLTNDSLYKTLPFAIIAIIIFINIILQIMFKGKIKSIV